MSELLNEARRRAAQQMEEKKREQVNTDDKSRIYVQKEQLRKEKLIRANMQLASKLEKIICDARNAGLNITVDPEGRDINWYGLVDNYYQHTDPVLMITISIDVEPWVAGSDFFSKIERSINQLKKNVEEKVLKIKYIYSREIGEKVEFFTSHDGNINFDIQEFREQIIEILLQLELNGDRLKETGPGTRKKTKK